jgi:hypothetical protein
MTAMTVDKPLSPETRAEARRLIAELTALLELLAEKIEQEHAGPVA